MGASPFLSLGPCPCPFPHRCAHNPTLSHAGGHTSGPDDTESCDIQAEGALGDQDSASLSNFWGNEGPVWGY